MGFGDADDKVSRAVDFSRVRKRIGTEGRRKIIFFVDTRSGELLINECSVVENFGGVDYRVSLLTGSLQLDSKGVPTLKRNGKESSM